MAEAYLIEGAVFQDAEDDEGYLLEGAVFQAGPAPAGGGVAPTSIFYGPLVGCLGGPI